MLGGSLGYWLLPVSSLPQVDFPTIQVTTQLPGASPDTVAALITAPLERTVRPDPVARDHVCRRARSASARSRCSSTSAATSTAPPRTCRPRSIRPPRCCRAIFRIRRSIAKVNPADAPILTLALTSDTSSLREMSDLADTLIAQRLSQVTGVGNVSVQGGIKPAVRIQADLARLASYGLGPEDLRIAIVAANVAGPKGALDGTHQAYTIGANDQIAGGGRLWRDHRLLSQRRAGAAQRRRTDHRRAGEQPGRRLVPGACRPSIVDVKRQPGANVIETVQADPARAAAPAARHARRGERSRWCTTAPTRSAPRCTTCSSPWCWRSRWWCWWC